jgi:hypothetical protein
MPTLGWDWLNLCILIGQGNFHHRFPFDAISVKDRIERVALGTAKGFRNHLLDLLGACTCALSTADLLGTIL